MDSEDNHSSFLQLRFYTEIMIHVCINDFSLGVIFLEPDKIKNLKINFLKIYLD